MALFEATYITYVYTHAHVCAGLAVCGPGLWTSLTVGPCAVYGQASHDRREGMQEEGRPLSTCGGPQNESADNSMTVM